MDDAELLPRRLAEAARSLQEEVSSVATMDLAVQLALGVVEGAEDASISLVRRGRIVETPAATSERALLADQIQYKLGDGPLLTGLWTDEVVSCPDLTLEDRWGAWGPEATIQTGIASLLCFRMFAGKAQLGALSVYSSKPHGFSAADVESGLAFAVHAAIAIAGARQDEFKDIALDSRSVIGQATGMIMERYQIDAVRAFAVLKRISQDNNIKLHEVAVQLLLTRVLPSG